VKPDVHRGRIGGVALVSQFLGELLAVRQAGIESNQLHQVDDGSLPVQFLCAFRAELRELGLEASSGNRRARSGGVGGRIEGELVGPPAGAEPCGAGAPPAAVAGVEPWPKIAFLMLSKMLMVCPLSWRGTAVWWRQANDRRKHVAVAYDPIECRIVPMPVCVPKIFRARFCRARQSDPTLAKPAWRYADTFEFMEQTRSGFPPASKIRARCPAMSSTTPPAAIFR